MTKKQLVEIGISKINSVNSAEASTLLGYLYDDLLASGITPSEIPQLWNTCINKLNDDIPLQYITNVAHFYGHVFHVSEVVLIPRPETEELVYNILKDLKKAQLDTAKILDIGTGSGCIPISLKAAKKSLSIEALDVSSSAIAVAKMNADSLDVDVDFKEIDFLKQEQWKDLGRYDIIVSNPPYIPHKEKELMSPNVLENEPHLALFVEDEDPLLFYRMTALFGKDHLEPGGTIYLELNEYNAADVAQLYKEHEYKEIRIIKDMQGKERMLVAKGC